MFDLHDLRRRLLRGVLIAGAATLPPLGAARADQTFDTCLAAMRADAVAAGISQATLDQVASVLQPNDVLHFQTEQPEFHTAVWDYLAGLVDEERVSDGRAMADKWAGKLAEIQTRFGVDGPILVAVWGVESDYGRTFGLRPIVQSLATLGCYGQRPAYFRSEWVAALKILQQGDVAADRFTGSWAGAFGHTQFMPSTFLRNAVDLDGTGHANIVDSVPDALATTANYLRKSGWVPGVRWGFEVKLPQGYAGPSGRKTRHPIAFWTAKGVTRVDGSTLTGPEAGLLLPAGPQGPALPRHEELRRDLRLQRRRGLRAGHLHARRPDRRRGAARDALAHGRSRPVAPRTARVADPAGLQGLRARQHGRRDRHQDAAGHRRLRGPDRSAGQRAGERERAEGAPGGALTPCSTRSRQPPRFRALVVG